MPAPAVLVREGFPALMPSSRALGRHLSDVTRSICAAYGDFDPDDRSVFPVQLAQLGLTFEWGLMSQLTHHYPGRYFRTWDEQYECWRAGLQVEKDGISGNLDGLNLGGALPWEPAVPGLWAVEDAKFTRKSRKHSQESAKWREAWMRVAGYCWMVGARVGRLWIAYTFDYGEKFGGDAVCQVWERRWDTPEGERELENNWAVIVRHERTMAPVRGTKA